MREPTPTQESVWSQWGSTPELPGYWPGLGLEHRDGFEVHQSDLRSIAGRITRLADAFPQADLPGNALIFDYYPDKAWSVGHDLSTAFHQLDSMVRRDFQGCMALDCALAGAITYQAESSYAKVNLAEAEKWMAKQTELISNSPYGGIDIGRRAPGEEPAYRPPDPERYTYVYYTPNYPRQAITVHTIDPSDDHVRSLSWDDINRILGNVEANPNDLNYVYSWTAIHSFHLRSLSDNMRETADLYYDTVYALLNRAQEMRDAWAGPAADTAQRGLRQLYASAEAMTYTAGAVTRCASDCADIIDWHADHFEQVVGPDYSEMGTKGLYGIPYAISLERARDYVRHANGQIRQACANLPRKVEYDLPDLIPETLR